MVGQRSKALNQTSDSCSEHWLVGWIGQKNTWCDTLQLPVPLGQMNRHWRAEKEEQGWFLNFVLFLINFGRVFLLWGTLQAGVRGGYGGIER